MVVLVQRSHCLYMAAKLDPGIAVYPWLDRAPDVHLSVEKV